MNAALYATIWSALALFVAGEHGKRALARGIPAPVARGAWLAWTVGGVLCALHLALALALRHGWSHAAAAAEIQRRTAAVYGTAWGGGIWINYLFVLRWLAEAWWWRAAPEAYVRRPRGVIWALRAFDLVILVNAAIVFASPVGRIAGVVLVGALLLAWRPARTAAPLPA